MYTRRVADRPKRVAVLGLAGTGKTRFGRALSERLGAPFVELDALHWRPGWVEATATELRELVEPLVAGETWVVDGAYRRKIGDLVLASADLVVWLDLPVWVWFPRLLRRTLRRAIRREEFLNGNRETLRGALWSRDSLLLYALRSRASVRRRYPTELAAYNLVRLRSRSDVDRFLRAL
ncbi:MAG: AAA family ATPase [Actinobacteria bacterium]|nr:MAG: AAA family ATPase [Actinomycetota bacterium]